MTHYFEEHPDVASWFAFGEGPDASVFFVFDGQSGHILEVGPILPDEAKDWGPSIAPLLDRLAAG